MAAGRLYGIGRAIVHRLHGLGGRVIVSAHSEAALQSFAAAQGRIDQAAY